MAVSALLLGVLASAASATPAHAQEPPIWVRDPDPPLVTSCHTYADFGIPGARYYGSLPGEACQACLAVANEDNRLVNGLHDVLGFGPVFGCQESLDGLVALERMDSLGSRKP